MIRPLLLLTIAFAPSALAQASLTASLLRPAAATGFTCVEQTGRCDASADCCSGFCSYQTCMDAPSSGGNDNCGYGGAGCGGDADCCSGYCSQVGVCQ